MRRFLGALPLLLLTARVHAQVTIDFDDLPGQPAPFQQGQKVGTDRLIDVEYLALGPLFDSGGGGLFLALASNPVSPPNTVTATENSPIGPVISYLVPAEATFWSGDRPAVVDFVALTLSSTTSPSTLEAFDFAGNLLGSSSGGALARLRVDAPGRIHRVVVQQGPMAFDDFTFDGLKGLSTLAVTPLLPGYAGSTSHFVVTGARPGEILVLSVEAVLASSAKLGKRFVLIADGAGRAVQTLNVPASLLGHRVRARVSSSGGSSPWSERVIVPLPAPTVFAPPEAEQACPPARVGG